MNLSQQRGHEWLATQGFNLQAVMRADQWPQRLRQSMEDCQVNIESTRRFVMLGAGGSLLWQQSGDDLTDSGHPLDTFSVNAAGRVVTEYWGGGEVEILYPGSLPVPLQQLGVFAGWSHVSPLRSLALGLRTGCCLPWIIRCRRRCRWLRKEHRAIDAWKNRAAVRAQRGQYDCTSLSTWIAAFRIA